MSIKDFEGIGKFKILILLLLCSLLIVNIIGPIFDYETYFRVYILVQKVYVAKGIYYLIMVILATAEGMKILKRVQRNEKHSIQNKKNIFHAIALPIYQEGLDILTHTLKKLASHQKAKQNYLIFLAMEEHSVTPEKRAMDIISTFQHQFRLMHYTVHQLLPGQAQGKASNLNFCLREMEKVFLKNSLDPQNILFTTLDCDTLAPEAYFQEIQFYLSQHQWDTDNYLFGPVQMFSINSQEIPFLNRHADHLLGAGVFVWANNITQCHNVASNYTISYNAIKHQNFYDTNPDAMCDDYHISNKSHWKSGGKIKIVPIFTMMNLMSLQTGGSYFSEIKARFWQAQRHMRGMLDAAYNFNMLFKNPLKLRTIWTTFAHFQTHFIPLGVFLTAYMFMAFKLISGREFTAQEIVIMRLDALINVIISFCYFFLVRKSSRIFYHQKSIPSWRLFFEQAITNKILLLFYVVIPELIATFNVMLKTPTYESASKITSEEFEQEEELKQN